MNQIESWLNDARWAPSAANNQPWQVDAEDRGHEIALQLRLTDSAIAKKSVMDPIGGAALLALGTLAETIVVLAQRDGYVLKSIQSQNKGDDLWTTTTQMVFLRAAEGHQSLDSKQQKVAAELAIQVPLRRTHREPLSRNELTERHLRIPYVLNSDGLLKVCDFGFNRLKWANQFSPLEKIRFDNRDLFHALLEDIQERDSQEKTGLPQNTLGASRLGCLILSKLKALGPRHAWFLTMCRWALCRTFVVESLLQPVQNCSHVYFISARGHLSQDWIHLGRFLQRVWLEFSAVGIGLHPMATSLLAYSAIGNSRGSALTKNERDLVIKINQDMIENFNLDLSQPGIFLRVGYIKTGAPASPRQPIPFSLIHA
ncbi:MAG: hypothetical protein J0L82_16670 [Deltaproteobacteria bacterium]|jgi:hypothetical protein|nr:hypothetical protein [Deltaproteobacteria bacterium]